MQPKETDESGKFSFFLTLGLATEKKELEQQQHRVYHIFWHHSLVTVQVSICKCGPASSAGARPLASRHGPLTLPPGE